LRALSKNRMPKRLCPTPEGAGSIPSGGFLRRQPGQCPWVASGMYQRGPALERPASDLFGILWCRNPQLSRKPACQPPLARSCAKAQPWNKEKPLGNTMDRSPKSPGQRALDDAFHAMFELSRTTLAPTLADLYPPHGVRIARPERMRRFMS